MGIGRNPFGVGAVVMNTQGSRAMRGNPGLEDDAPMGHQLMAPGPDDLDVYVVSCGHPSRLASAFLAVRKAEWLVER